jgi:hypothetical protein
METTSQRLELIDLLIEASFFYKCDYTVNNYQTPHILLVNTGCSQ